MDTSTSIIPKQ